MFADRDQLLHRYRGYVRRPRPLARPPHRSRAVRRWIRRDAAVDGRVRYDVPQRHWSGAGLVPGRARPDAALHRPSPSAAGRHLWEQLVPLGPLDALPLGRWPRALLSRRSRPRVHTARRTLAGGFCSRRDPRSRRRSSPGVPGLRPICPRCVPRPGEPSPRRCQLRLRHAADRRMLGDPAGRPRLHRWRIVRTAQCGPEERVEGWRVAHPDHFHGP